MKPSSNLLAPDNHALVLIDFEGQMGFATKSQETYGIGIHYAHHMLHNH